MTNPFDAVASTYDADSAAMFAPEVLDPAVDFLADLASPAAPSPDAAGTGTASAGSGREGSALEFAIGTGRVGLPLSRRGVRVSGIELSAPMVEVLRNKPGGSEIPVVIGDMATTRIEGEFDLVFCVFNSVTNLLTQAEQVECFRNAARHLRPGGCFVAEVFVPQIRKIPFGETVAPFEVTEKHIGIDKYDLLDQTVVSFHYSFGEGTARTFQSAHRYAWPAEFDLMAELAGMRLRERWEDWDRSPFTADSESHVSVWELP